MTEQEAFEEFWQDGVAYLEEDADLPLLEHVAQAGFNAALAWLRSQAEPVAWMSPGKERLEFSRHDTVYGSHTIPLYLTPQVVERDDREYLSAIALLGSAMRRLVIAARTSGGTAGPDAELMAACEQAEDAMTVGAIGRAMEYAAPQPAIPDGWKSDAARDVLAERRRQTESEGWTLKHDDEHRNGEMAAAAACYALNASVPMPKFRPPYWPWADKWWKPKDPRRDLVRAAALILAEIERLDRTATEPRE